MKAKVIKVLRIVIRALKGVILVLGGKICSRGRKKDSETNTEE